MPEENRNVGRWLISLGVIALLIAAFISGQAVAGTPSNATLGPFTKRQGISMGFARSEPGAEAAAAHYLLEIERAMDSLDRQRALAVAALVATPAEARAMSTHAAEVIALERADGAPLRRVAISTALIAYSPSAAQVTVLESWFYATANQEALWAIERVSLAWAGGDWRISRIDGASPSANESLAELRAQLNFPGVGDASVR